MREGVDRRGWLALLAQGVAGWLFARQAARAAPAPAPAPPPPATGSWTYYREGVGGLAIYEAGGPVTAVYDPGGRVTCSVYSTHPGAGRQQGSTPPPPEAPGGQDKGCAEA